MFYMHELCELWYRVLQTSSTMTLQPAGARVAKSKRIVVTYLSAQAAMRVFERSCR
jgi:hypothetical protein